MINGDEGQRKPLKKKGDQIKKKSKGGFFLGEKTPHIFWLIRRSGFILVGF